MKKGITVITKTGSTAPTNLKMLINATAGMGHSALHTWAVFGGQGYENAAALPPTGQTNIVAYNCVLDKLEFGVFNAPTGILSYTVTIWKSTDQGATWAATALTATITGAAKTASDLVHSVALNAGDWISIAYDSTVGTPTQYGFISVRETAS